MEMEIELDWLKSTEKCASNKFSLSKRFSVTLHSFDNFNGCFTNRVNNYCLCYCV